MTKVAILSRYQENDNSWYNILKDRYDNIIVFNKFDGENKLPNIGREGHTYLYYIVNHYENLPEELLFSQYSPLDHFNKLNPSNNRGTNHVNDFLNSHLYDFICIRPTDYDLFVRKRKIEWLNNFNELYNTNSNINKIISTGACLNGIFRVSREAILKHDIHFYIRGLDMLSRGKNPNEGFFFERAWKYIFTNYGNCPEKYSSFKDSIWLFGNPSFSSLVTDRKDRSYGHIKLYEDGCISSNNYCYYGHSNEHHWSINDDVLYFFSCTGSITSTYKLSNISENTTQLFGTYYDSKGIHENKLLLKKALYQY